MKTQKNTKIIATLGPSCEDTATIEKMVKAGMNAARLNFSHGTYEQFRKIIKNIREVSKKLGEPIAIIQDLQGPKIRVGEMPADGITIKKGEKIILTTKQIKGKRPYIPVQYQKLPGEVKKGSNIFIDDGLIRLEVEKTTKTAIYCKVLTDGLIKSRKGINASNANISANPLTAKDKKDLAFGLSENVEYVALSFVRSAADIQTLRKMIEAKNKNVKIIAKIERQEAVENLKAIIKASDAIMVARGDLGIETEPERVPIIQKKIIHLAKIYGRPVIVATQMLQSMIENPIATRAEVSDAANAVYDQADALMLSNETAVGKFPVKAVETLAKVAFNVEKEIAKHEELFEKNSPYYDVPIANATCLNGAKLAMDINARYIVAISMSGFTAQHIAKHRLHIPIITITEDKKVLDQLALVWGLNKIFIRNIHLDKFTSEVKTFLKNKNLVKKGDEIVIVSNASKKEKLISTIKI